MKHISILSLTFLLIITTGTNCKKNKLSELEKLPPATQTGAKTFGCLVNGKAWIPSKEDWFSTSALRFYYDNSPGGQFGIIAEYQNSSQNRNEAIVIVCDSILSKSIYELKNDNIKTARVSFRNSKISGICYSLSSSDNDTQTNGLIKITRLDLIQGIICGIFEFSLSKQGCETIHITNGRFDAKL